MRCDQHLDYHYDCKKFSMRDQSRALKRVGYVLMRRVRGPMIKVCFKSIIMVVLDSLFV